MLALSLMGQGKPEEAEPLLRESLVLRRHTLPPDHWLLATSGSILGECLVQLGEYQKAEKLLLDSYETLKTKLGTEHEQTRNALERIKKFQAAL
jgi:hypothetical protein